MMKKALLYILFFVSALVSAQNSGSFTLEWKEVAAVNIDSVIVKLPRFNEENAQYIHSEGKMLFAASVPAGGKMDEQSLRLTNIVYENITPAELGDLRQAAIPATPAQILRSINARGEWRAVISLSPFVKEGNSYKRIKSFSYSFSPASAVYSVAAVPAVGNSVLATGSWYRFTVTKSGVYRLSRSFLQSLGFDTGVDPRTVKIYGNGGRMAPMLNATDYPMDIAENAVKFVGEEDGSFDSGDYILFYAEGVDNWNAESATNNNLYNDKAYYYVTAGAGSGKRVQAMAQPTANPVLTLDSFDDYVFHEQDLVNIAHLGRKWHGEQFNIENEQVFDFTIPDINTQSPVSITVSGAANGVVATSMAVAANNTQLGNLNFSGVTDHLNMATDATYSGTFTASGGNISIKLTFNNSGLPAANAWLDYINITAKRFLRGSNNQYRFRYKAAGTVLGAIQYNFTNANSVSEVWDITDIYNATAVVNDAGATFSFKGAGGEAREYIAVNPNDYFTPVRESNARISNVNLKGTIFRNGNTQFSDIDYIIVAPRFLASPAEKLANIHRTRSGMNVKVVALEDVYQEFSSGQQDIGAIRNFIKYVYVNASSAANRIKYLNLFGETSFDYKRRTPGNTNIVPSVHAIRLSASGTSNYSLVDTFVTDDFYGAMDDNEGEMLTSGTSYGLDIAVGRMLATTVSDANEQVNKVVEYLSEESYGRWRNEYVMLSDDVDAIADTTFMPSLETVGNAITNNKPFVNIRKVYMDSYVQQASSGGQRYPEAKEQLLRYINNGALVVNYLGHGGTGGMSSERIFESADAQNLTNQYKYPLFITTTCELTKFDDPYLESVGEYLYKNPSGGGIAMITTTRAIYISAATTINAQLSGRLYSYAPTNTYEYPSMAEAFRQTKFASNNVQFITCVSFIGDPALHLAIPKINVVLTAINDVPVGSTPPVLQSLAYAKLTGRVTDESGTTISSYNGQLEATVFDKNIDRTTLNNDGHDQQRPFSTIGEAIFRGSASVSNGQFEFGFIVPRDIKVPVGNGRVSFYSRRANVLEDQTGVDTSIQIGGVNTNAEADNTPPTVKLYMNDESFVSGGITNNAPILLAYLEDAHGINTSSGIGHDIIGILDGDETNPFVMNDYYVADPDNYTRGKVTYPFINLEKGLHTLQFQAWDVYNNLVTAEIQFVVSGSDELTLDKVLNYPNPFVSYTEFWFNHNRPFEPLDVQVQIFTVTGKIVKTINQQVTTDGFLSRDLKWDGRDDFGDKIGKGVYIYKLTVKSSTTNKKAEKFEKLVLL